MSRHTTNPEGKRILAQLRKLRPFLQASLTLTRKRCGNPKCRCAEVGPLHEAALLTWAGENNKTQTLSVPRALRSQVAQWVEENRRLKQLIHQMSEAQREFLLEQKQKLKRRGK